MLIGYGIGAFLGKQIWGFIEDLPNMWEAAENELRRAGQHFTNLFNKLPKDIQNNFNYFGTSINDYISSFLTSISSPTVNAIGSVAKHIPNVIISIIMCFLSAYFFIAEKDYLNHVVQDCIPNSILRKWNLVYNSLRQSVGG